MKKKIIKQIVESLGDGTGGKMDYRICHFIGEWWIICDPIGSAEPVHDWLNRELDRQYLNECIEKATPNLSKIKDVDKELAEIKGEDKRCYNCKYHYLLPDDFPCDKCICYNSWEPIKTE